MFNLHIIPRLCKDPSLIRIEDECRSQGSQILQSHPTDNIKLVPTATTVEMHYQILELQELTAKLATNSEGSLAVFNHERDQEDLKSKCSASATVASLFPNLVGKVTGIQSLQHMPPWISLPLATLAAGTTLYFWYKKRIYDKRLGFQGKGKSISARLLTYIRHADAHVRIQWTM